MTYTREDWASRLPEEAEFWRKLIFGTYPIKDWVYEVRQRVAGTFPFPDSCVRYLNADKTRILDVGAGPASILCPDMAPRYVEVVAVDPLADTYNQLLAEAKLQPRVRTQRGEGERLSELNLGKFDLVYSRNALDHSYDPIRVIKEMVKVCAPAGVVFFEGAVNESLNEKGQGLHQWNFMPVDNGDLIIWRPDNTAYSLRSALEGLAQVKARGNKWYNVEIRPL
jgi:2-polyprenyl-3-methyl-5-hydroxy-6-metoxy-1,4-benzoquinol methylase